MLQAKSGRKTWSGTAVSAILAVSATLVSAGCDALTDLSDRLETVVLDDIETITESSTLTRQVDPDQDGLSTVEETQVGTDPREADSDGDLVPDKRELELGTDPTTADSELTIDGVPSAFDGLIEPGASRTFYRGPNAIATAYIRLMGLVRSETRLTLDWRMTDTQVPRATTQITLRPNEYWCWGHDLGPAAIISEPAEMTLTRLTVTVEEGGDSVFYTFISSGGLTNGARGLLPFSPILAQAEFDFNLVMAHGAFRDASGWDSFVMLLERIAPEVQVIRTSADPQGMIERRAGQLSRFIQREGLNDLYVIAHSQGGLDARYILTEAAMGDPHFSVTAQSLCGLYTMGTPHRGLTLTPLTEGLPDDLFLDDAAVPEPEPAAGPGNPSAATIDTMNAAFPGDVTIGDRVIPVVALVFHADFHALTASDGVVKLFSQAFGEHVINDVPSPRAGGPGSGRHVRSIPSRSEAEQGNFFVLGRILEDIVQRRAATDGSDPCP